MITNKQILEFKRKYHLKEINSDTLRKALVAQGYTVVEFNNIENNPDVVSLIEALNLQGQIACSKCFTYQNDKYRLVFLHEDLNEEERTIVLAHEEGHIWNRHLSGNYVFGNDIIQEHEANEFAHHLLDDRTGKKERTKLVVFAFVLFILIAAGTGTVLYKKKEKRYREMIFKNLKLSGEIT